VNNMPDEATNEYLEDVISDGRLTEPSDGKRYRLREAIQYSKNLEDL